VPPALRDYCESFDHDIHNCPYTDYVDAKCLSLKKIINKVTDKMIETMKEKIAKYSHRFDQSKEHSN